MTSTGHRTTLLLLSLLPLTACEKAEPPPQPEAAKSAPPPAATPTPPPIASAPPEPHHDCPEGSEGPGSFAKPCVGNGAARMMEIAWTGKSNDAGAPSFRVVSKAKLVILYGKLVVYFYDKAGKQLDVPAGASGKPRRHQDCSGNIFGGAMQAGEKAVINFSCAGKSSVPEGASAIEAEIEMVGFADDTGKKSEFYWKNEELTPEERPKGGVKAAAKKK